MVGLVTSSEFVVVLAIATQCVRCCVSARTDGGYGIHARLIPIIRER
jgi:hypothetical protein